MKKTIYLFGMAALALAFTACNQKEEDTSLNRAGDMHYATVTLGKDVATKTTVVEGNGSATYQWCDNDDQYLKIYENGVEGTIEEFTLNSAKTKATLVVSFQATSKTKFLYEARYAKDVSKARNPLVQAEQTPTTASFDPAADVLVSAITDSVTTRLTNFSLDMGRPVTVNKMTLTGLEAGEVISSVEFTLDQHMVGYISYDKTEQKFECSNGGKTITISYEGTTTAEGLVPSNGEFPVYFISAPVEDASIVSVVVRTNQNVYTKAGYAEEGDPFYGKTISFNVGQMTRFKMAMAGYGEPISEGTPYTLVSSQSDLQDGASYLIVASKNDVFYALGAQAGNNRTATSIPAPVDGVITIDNTSTPYPVTITAVGQNWYIIDNYPNSDKFGQYIYNASSNKSYLRSEAAPDTDQKAEWTIAIADGVATINNVGNTDRGCLVMNYNNGSPLFNVYGSVGSYSTLSLYVGASSTVTLEDPGLAFSEGVTAPIEVDWADKDSFVPPTLTNPHKLTITWSSEKEDVATVDANGAITFVGNGTTTITASSAKTNQYEAGSASYQLTVSGKPGNPGTTEETALTVSEALEVIADMENNGVTADSVYVHGIISEVISFNSTYNSINYNITADGSTSSDALYVYSGKGLNGANFTSINDLTVGDEVVIKGKLKKYVSNNTTTPEFTSNSKICSIIKAPFFNATLSASTIGYAGGDLTLTISANTAWTVSINGGATLGTPTAAPSASVSGNSDAEVTVHIPANNTSAAVTYTITMNPTGVAAPNALTITQAAQGEEPKGSEANPYTVAEALVEINKLNDNEVGNEEVYVTAVVANVVSYNSTYKSLTYNIKDADGSDVIQVYSGKGLDGADFTSTADLSEGDILVVKGKLQKYVNNNVATPEIYRNSQIVSLTRLPHFAATLSNNVIGYNGGELSLTISADVQWTASIDKGASLKIGSNAASASVSGEADAVVSIIIPQNENGETYTISFSSTSSTVTVPAAIQITQSANSGTKWNLVESLSDLTEGTYIIAALSNDVYYTVPNTTISAQIFTCIEASYSDVDGLTPASGTGEFTFTPVTGVSNAYYIYNTTLELYLVATGSKKFGYVSASSSDYGYWTFSEVSTGGFSGQFSVQHSDKSQYMRAYNNSVRCYDGASNQGVYLFINN